MKKSDNERVKNEGAVFRRVVMAVVLILFINVVGVLYEHGDFSEGVTGFSIKETIANVDEDTSPISKVFLVTQFAMLGFALFLARPKRSQAAMEFLMTYGWAIMVAIIAVGVLSYFGVFSPGKYTVGIATINPPFYIVAWSTQSNGITFDIRNNGPERYDMQEVDVRGCGTNEDVVPISPNEIKNVFVGCDLSGDNTFKGDVVVKYRKSGSLVDLSSKGTIADKVIVNNTPVFSYTLITTCLELQDMNLNLTENYMLDNDIDCSGTVGWGGGAGFEPVGDASNNFEGNFDGQDFVISNLYINLPASGNVGLFGVVSNTATIIDVGLENVDITSNYRTGGLIGQNWGEVSNSYSTGTVSGINYFIGGLIGKNSGEINNCYSTANVNGDNTIGGLIGHNSFKDVINCYSIGDVNGVKYVGGLVGYLHTSNIKNSYSTGDVSTGLYVGGLVGEIFGVGELITNSYWNNHAGNPGSCVGSITGGGTIDCTEISDNEAYFYDVDNPPMDVWNFPPWSNTNNGVDFPVLG